LQLGRYRLDEQVGQGGMAVVWRGFDTQLRRAVAVKVLHPHLHGREEIRKRFAREAQAVARLHHPHILDVYDSSDPEAEPSWLVMEFVRGTNLRAFADQHPFDPPELAACCLVPLADALEHAHQGGVIHRDLKPENVMVREDGTVKLTDFGIAAIVEPDEKFTATGQILGSPAHLAPEIIEGKPATPQSDLFSLGTMLYWLSCGKLPFLAPTPAALLRLILDCKPIDPRRVRPSVADAQARLVMRCLSKDPAQRPKSAAELSREVLSMLAESGIDDPRRELSGFVQGIPPELHAQGLRAKLVERSLHQGEQALAEKKTTQALGAFSRALSLDPRNAQAREQVERIHRRSRRNKLVRRSALGASLAVIVGVGGPRAARVWREQHPATPSQPAVVQPPSVEQPTVVAGQPSTAAPAESPAAADPEDEEEDPPRSDTAVPPRKTPPRAPPPRPDVPAAAPRTVRVALPPSSTLYVDGKYIGAGEPFYPVELLPGPHKAIVQKEGFNDLAKPFFVDPQTTEVRLKLGEPRDAAISFVNAPRDAPVRIDDSFVGSVGELALKPMKFSLKGQAERAVKITVGDQSFEWKIRAGQERPIDLKKASR
jgi:serine/threonine-protein kinase